MVWIHISGNSSSALLTSGSSKIPQHPASEGRTTYPCDPTPYKWFSRGFSCLASVGTFSIILLFTNGRKSTGEEEDFHYEHCIHVAADPHGSPPSAIVLLYSLERCGAGVRVGYSSSEESSLNQLLVAFLRMWEYLIPLCPPSGVLGVPKAWGLKVWSVPLL